MIVHPLDTVQACKPARIFISAASPADYSGVILADNFPGSGLLGGIERALEAAASPFILVLAGDMPFIPSGTLRRLAAHVQPNRGVVPRIEDRVQPLAAFCPRSAHTTLLRLLGEGLRSAVHFADTRVCFGLARYADLHYRLGHESANRNTPADVARGSAA